MPMARLAGDDNYCISPMAWRETGVGGHRLRAGGEEGSLLNADVFKSL